MSLPIEEQVMVALINVLAAIQNDDTTPSFKTVARGRLVSQALTDKMSPAVSVFRIVDREVPNTRTMEKSKLKWVFGLDISGSEEAQPEIDTELIDLKSRCKKALVNNNLGGLTGSIIYRGSDTSEFAPIPQGNEICAFETLLVTNASDPWTKN